MKQRNKVRAVTVHKVRIDNHENDTAFLALVESNTGLGFNLRMARTSIEKHGEDWVWGQIVGAVKTHFGAEEVVISDEPWVGEIEGEPVSRHG